MTNVLKVKIRAQRIKYEVMKITFEESDLQKAKGCKWVNKGNSLYYTDNKLDILRDYETFDTTIAGVAIHPIREIDYELGNIKGVVARDNVLSAINHPILMTIRDVNNGDGMTLLNADMYYDDNSIEYTIEIGDRELDASLFEIITISCPITGEEHIVEIRYDGKKMKGGAEGFPYRGDPLSRTSMLTVPKDYADALHLGENKKLDNILRFEDFMNENMNDGKKPINTVKSVKDFMQISEDYIHSFINEHEPDHEPEEE
jgi:hypothetical protein